MITSSTAWWATCNDLFAEGNIRDGYKDFIRDEYEAHIIECFQNSIIPGLLQTEAYSRAASGMHWPAPGTQKEIDAWVTIRLKRQWGIFDRPERPKLHFIVDEGALYRRVGGPAVLYEQLTHLLKITSLQDFTLQILPLHEGGPLYPYPLAGFVIFSFEAKGKKATLYDDLPVSFSERVEGAHSLFMYQRVFVRLHNIADSPADSKARIQKAIRELDASNEHRVQAGGK